MTGRVYLADTSSVYQILCSLTTSTPAEEWTKASNPRSGGRVAFRALVNHYSGSGFASCQMGEDVQLDKTLHYKNERVMQFATFALKLQHILNLYRDFDQELTQNAKLQHLFQKVNSDGLANCIAALESQHNLINLSFDQTINHLATIISKSQNNTRFSQVFSAGSSFDRFNSGRNSRGRGRGGNSRRRRSPGRGSARGRGRGRGGKWVEPHLWANMSHEDRIKHKNPQKVLDTNTISIISAVTQATLDNMKIILTNNNHSSKSHENYNTHDAGNLFEVAMKRRQLKRERILNNVCIIVLVIYLQFKMLQATIVNDVTILLK